VIQYGGVVNNADFLGSSVSPGDIVVAKGDQLSLRAADFSGLPLATSLGGAKVLVNDTAAPLYYSSFGQIAFQIPSSTANGMARVQVIRDGEAGNTVSVNVVSRAPRTVALTGADDLRIGEQHPAAAGARITIWAIGMGPTTPSVPDGELPQGIASLTVTPTLRINSDTQTWRVKPDFAGLSGGAAGLYQVNLTLPADLTPGKYAAWLEFPDATSDTIAIWIR